MFKNEMVQMLVELQKKGVSLYLTDEGYREFLLLMRDEFKMSIHLPEVG